ncbi:HAD family hydrolase [Hydrogenispora ethanolica]|nr:HAD family hydrolase [Hydrogenispora ethanolica]
MTAYQEVFFDLDGTLTDPAEGIVNSICYALSKLGIIANDRERLLRFIGPPLQESFEKYYGLDAQTAWQAVQFYREYFGVSGLFENTVYPGILELLADLQRQNLRLSVATSKPTVYSERILSHFGLAHFFEHIIGSNLDGTRSTKTEVIAELLKSLESPDRSKVVMVGDREHDIIGARNHGIASIAVAYGYGTMEELTAAHPTGIAGSVSELGALLSGRI